MTEDRSLQAMKHQVYTHLDASPGDTMRASLRLMEESLRGEGFKEGVASYTKDAHRSFTRLTVETAPTEAAS